jgi:hypothetical protein
VKHVRMSNESGVPAPERGPIGYENWRAAIEGAPAKIAHEFPLFTDAHIIGELRDSHSPYELLNTIPLPPNAQILLPAIVLRVTYYLRFDASTLDLRRTDFKRYHGGELNDEIAALVSLCLGIRLKSGSPSREFRPGGDPRGRPRGPRVGKDPILLKPTGRAAVLPGVLGQHSLADASLLSTLPRLTPGAAVALVCAARLYQDALWIAESQPELSWIMLVSAVEAAAGYWRASQEPAVERLRAAEPELASLLENAGGETLCLEVADMIADYMGVTKKFVDFVLEFMPPPPQERPPESAQHPWDNKTLEQSLRAIYRWRSRALHSGVRFPLPMCEPMWPVGNVLAEKPMALAVATADAAWRVEDTPMLLHVFEHIARHALLGWWASMLPPTNQAG